MSHVITTVLFDLDGTLLPMDQDVFVHAYFQELSAKLAPYGYDSKSLIKNIWTGVAGMIANDGTYTNEEIFWSVFSKDYGDKVLKDKPIFDEFYKKEFQKVQGAVGFSSQAIHCIDVLKDNGMPMILATNPIFPQQATYSRIKWAGLEPSDFQWITTYENSHSCKPNLIYYKEILDKFNLDPATCLMVGNDVSEDMVATKLGMPVFLIKNCLINKNKEDISSIPQGDFRDLLRYLYKQYTEEVNGLK